MFFSVCCDVLFLLFVYRSMLFTPTNARFFLFFSLRECLPFVYSVDDDDSIPDKNAVDVEQFPHTHAVRLSLALLYIFFLSVYVLSRFFVVVVAAAAVTAALHSVSFLVCAFFLLLLYCLFHIFFASFFSWRYRSLIMGLWENRNSSGKIEMTAMVTTMLFYSLLRSIFFAWLSSFRFMCVCATFISFFICAFNTSRRFFFLFRVLSHSIALVQYL